jgi:hypothetical protein
MDADTAFTTILKHRANIQKLGKTVLADKDKADAVKDIDGVVTAYKPLQEIRKKLEARIKDIDKLKSDIATYNAALLKTEDKARAAAKSAGGVTKSDTPTRDFFMIANLMINIGNTPKLELP